MDRFSSLIGVPPAQFALIVVLSRMVESLSHANVRLTFGRVGDRVLVSPRFHRVHHAIGIGHEGAYRGCNFAVLFPVWDVLFGTANFNAACAPTGVRDQLAGGTTEVVSGVSSGWGCGVWPRRYGPIECLTQST